MRRMFWYTFGVAAAAALAAGCGTRSVVAAPKATAPVKMPTTTVKVPEGRQVATLAAGCFWSMEAIFKQLKGVDKVEPGYAGGRVANPGYEQVESGRTGHAESVQIVFDPKVITYRDLLQVLLTVRDPTTKDRQGPDEGPQYRSIIFYHNAEQQKLAREAIAQVAAAHVWKAPIVTEVEPFTNFYRAEDYHLDYYHRHPDEPYCKDVIAPEIADFQAKFKSRLKP